MKKLLLRLSLLCTMCLFALGVSAEDAPDYLCFTANEDNSTIQIGQKGTPTTVTLQYKINDGDWTNFSFGTISDGSTISPAGTIITLQKGNKVYFRNNASSVTGFSTGSSNCYQFAMTGSISASGNVMSLVDKTCGTKEIPCDNCFYKLFSDCSSLTTAPELPATTLAASCYYYMFEKCSSLTTPPELPATTLAATCYYRMFYNCSSLITAPELPATTLALGCYFSMFENCSNLTTPPELPATTLADRCYGSMFEKCLGLTTAPELPATTLTGGCYNAMFRNCSNLTTAPELPATTLTEMCYYAMFANCSKLTTAPELPATTLAKQCYGYMFNGCSSLTTAPELPATTLAVRCYDQMFYACSSLNFVKAAFTKWGDFSNSGASDFKATASWLDGVPSTGTFICPSGLDTNTRSANNLPEGWTVVNPSVTEITTPGSAYVNESTTFTTDAQYVDKVTYYVRKNEGSYDAALEGDTFTPDEAGTYYVKAEATDITFTATKALTEKSFTVKALPEITSFTVTPTSGYVGDTFTFAATPNYFENKPTISYYVKKSTDDNYPEDPLSGKTFIPSAAGTYKVKVVAECEGEPSAEKEETFTVKAIPEFTIFRPTSGCVGNTYTFYAKAINFVGDPTISYYVKKDGGSYGDALQDNSFTPQEAGTYYVKAVATCAGERTAEKEIIFSVDQFSLTVSELGWASLYFNEDLVIPADTKAYYASEQNGDLVTLLPIKNSIPKNTAVIVKAEPGKYVFPFAEEDVDALEETNLFTGLLVDTPTSTVQALPENVGKSLYVLAEADKDGMPVFKIYNGETLGAYKMYMPINGGAEIKLVVKGDDFADGIVNIADEAADSRMYNTMGMPVSNSYEGIILKGGKKFMNIKR